MTVACGTETFHNMADRRPEAIDVALLARYARAFANGGLMVNVGERFII